MVMIKVVVVVVVVVVIVVVGILVSERRWSAHQCQQALQWQSLLQLVQMSLVASRTDTCRSFLAARLIVASALAFVSALIAPSFTP